MSVYVFHESYDHDDVNLEREKFLHNFSVFVSFLFHSLSTILQLLLGTRSHKVIKFQFRQLHSVRNRWGERIKKRKDVWRKIFFLCDNCNVCVATWILSKHFRSLIIRTCSVNCNVHAHDSKNQLRCNTHTKLEISVSNSSCWLLLKIEVEFFKKKKLKIR